LAGKKGGQGNPKSVGEKRAEFWARRKGGWGTNLPRKRGLEHGQGERSAGTIVPGEETTAKKL